MRSLALIVALAPSLALAQPVDGQKRIGFVVEPHIGHGVDEGQLVNTYCSFDVQLSTTQGEGFGLTTFEGMACGVPQIAPNWSALGELCKDAAFLVPCTTHACTLNGINVVGGIADREATIAALDLLYRDRELRAQMREKGLALVAQPQYRWENVGVAFAEAIEAALYPMRPR